MNLQIGDRVIFADGRNISGVINNIKDNDYLVMYQDASGVCHSEMIGKSKLVKLEKLGEKKYQHINVGKYKNVSNNGEVLFLGDR